MIINYNLADIGIKICEYLKTNSVLIDFANTEFGKPINYYAGELLHKQIPNQSVTPYIVVCELTKDEGIEDKWCEVHCKIVAGVGTGTKAEIVTTESGIRLLDSWDVSNQFATLIIQELHKRQFGRRPMARVQYLGAYPVESDGSHWASIIDCVWRIYPTMGTAQEDF